MKKMNKKGFTLIELLAVIVIMGILFATAGTAISRIIENSRKDTYISTIKSYVNGASDMWSADNIRCSHNGRNYVSSAVPVGTYYIYIDSSSPGQYPNLLEKNGKSSWGSRDIKGWIKVDVENVAIKPAVCRDASGANVSPADNGACPAGSTVVESAVYSRKITFYPVVTDGIHGINATYNATTKTFSEVAGGSLIPGDDIVRGNIVMDGVDYPDLSKVGGELPAGCIEV